MRAGLLAAVLALGVAAGPAPPTAPAPPTPPATGGVPAALPPAPPKPRVPPAEIAAPPEVAGLLGYKVLSSTGKHLGRIVDVLVDGRGVVRGVVIDIGGFMGIGARKVAVAWRALAFSSSKDGPVVTVEVPAKRLRAAPAVEPGKPIVMLNVPSPGTAR